MSPSKRELAPRLKRKLKQMFFRAPARHDESHSPSIRFPDYELIVTFNALALILFPYKKGDKHEILDSSKVRAIANEVKSVGGDIYDQAVFLLRKITSVHAFASGNKRTALLITIHFLKSNGIDVFIKDNPLNSDVLLGLRNVPNYYDDEEIKTWFKTGTIKKYVRPYPEPKNKGKEHCR